MPQEQQLTKEEIVRKHEQKHYGEEYYMDSDLSPIYAAMEEYAAQFKPAPPVSRAVKPLSEISDEHLNVAAAQMEMFPNELQEFKEWLIKGNNIGTLKAYCMDYLRQFYDIPNAYASAYPINGDVEITVEEALGKACGRLDLPFSTKELGIIYEAMRIYALSLPNGEKWVRVEDGLPPKQCRYYLTREENMGIRITAFDGIAFIRDGVDMPVTHWMQLPSPPKSN